jgi:DNA repair protein RecO (recombination protein O)
MSDKQRVDGEPALILHSYPFRETSLVLEAFSEGHGRIALVARGARRSRSALRGMLQPFQPLALSWFGKGEIKTLHGAEWRGGLPTLTGLPLICGFYLNELLVRLLPRDDPHERLFRHYHEALAQLGLAGEEAQTLRRFESRLLKEIGYAPTFDREAESGQAVMPDASYRFRIEKGVYPLDGPGDGDGLVLRGRTLLDMAMDDYHDPFTQREAKQLMRNLINRYLDGKPLHSRQLLKDLNQL